MKSTVIIPNYNGMKFIENCMKAMKKETSTQYQIIIVDNGSVDGSRQWIEENCPQVTLIAMGENTGFCGAVNAGIKAATTPYVILLNNDTEVEYGFVKALDTIRRSRLGVDAGTFTLFLTVFAISVAKLSLLP